MHLISVPGSNFVESPNDMDVECVDKIKLIQSKELLVLAEPWIFGLTDIIGLQNIWMAGVFINLYFLSVGADHKRSPERTSLSGSVQIKSMVEREASSD